MPRDSRRAVDLEPDEHVLATAHASFRGAAASSVRATVALGAGRVRDRAHAAWRSAAIDAGFADAADDMILGLTERRLLVGKPDFWGRGHTFTDAVDLADIARLAVVRHGIVTGVAFAMRQGPIVEIEAMRGRKLRALASMLEEMISR